MPRVLLGVFALLIGCGATTVRDVASDVTVPETATTVTPKPTTTTTAAPQTTTTTEPTKERIVINGVGDTNVDPSYIPALAANGYDHALSGLDGLFLDDDLTLINLECTPSELGTKQPRPFNFRCDVAALPFLTEAGVEVSNLANNHAMDYGEEAAADGVKQVRAAGMAAVGVGANRTEAFAPALLQVKGWDIAVFGFGANYLSTTWLATDDKPGMSDGIDIEAMTAAIAAVDDDVDLVIASIHWCCELETTPNARNRAHTEAMIAAGADIVLGHHHHRLQPLEIVDGAVVAWGLGNFVWPRLSAAGSDTAVAQVIVESDATMDACLLPVTIVSSGHPTLDDPSVRTCTDLR